MKLYLPLFQTEEGAFNNLILNYVEYPVLPDCYREVDEELMRVLGYYQISHYLHENKLYFVYLVKDDSERDIFRRIEPAFELILSQNNCFKEDFVKNINGFSKNLIGNVYINLSGGDDKREKFVNIVRVIIYRYFNVVYRFRGRVIYIKRIPDSGYLVDRVYIGQGIRVLFEISQKGRGRLWFDIVTHAFRDDDYPEPLSHERMKKESLELYKRYLEYARMPPKERYNKLMEALQYLKISDNINIKWYVWDVENSSLSEWHFVFKRVT